MLLHDSCPPEPLVIKASVQADLPELYRNVEDSTMYSVLLDISYLLILY